MENKIKLSCLGGTLLCFIENDKGEIEIDKNNYQDVATLTIENIIQLRDFLNTF